MSTHKKRKKNTGQALLEYVILSTLIGIFCLVAMKQFGQVLRTRINHMKNEVVRMMPR